MEKIRPRLYRKTPFRCLKKMIEILQSQGWTVDNLKLGNTAWTSATKEFQTTVGLKTAIIYIDKNNNITAEYNSEGRNILENCSGNDINNVLNDVYQKIDHSYARKLLCH